MCIPMICFSESFREIPFYVTVMCETFSSNFDTTLPKQSSMKSRQCVQMWMAYSMSSWTSGMTLAVRLFPTLCSDCLGVRELLFSHCSLQNFSSTRYELVDAVNLIERVTFKL